MVSRSSPCSLTPLRHSPGGPARPARAQQPWSVDPGCGASRLSVLRVTYPFSRSVPGCYAVILSGMGTLTPTARGSGPQISGSGGPLHEAVESPLPRHFQPWLCSGILRTRLLPAVPPHHLTLPSAGPRPACWSSLGPSSWF